jgi:hypothetical protein
MPIGHGCLRAGHVRWRAREGCHHVCVASITREELEAAVRAAWARDTCDPVDVGDLLGGHEVIQQPRVMQWPSELPRRAAEQYLTLKHRVLRALGLTERVRSEGSE